MSDGMYFILLIEVSEDGFRVLMYFGGLGVWKISGLGLRCIRMWLGFMVLIWLGRGEKELEQCAKWWRTKSSGTQLNLGQQHDVSSVDSKLYGNSPKLYSNPMVHICRCVKSKYPYLTHFKSKMGQISTRFQTLDVYSQMKWVLWNMSRKSQNNHFKH